MDQPRNRTLCLILTNDDPFLPVLTGFVETAAVSFGLAREDALKLVLAAEEIFLYLCRSVTPGSVLEVESRDGLYDNRLTFGFAASGLNLRGLNIVPAESAAGEEAPEELGLMIASRSVEGLDMTVEQGNRVRLALTKEKSYPVLTEVLPRPLAPCAITVERPDPEQVKRFALLARQAAGPGGPAFFATPGRLVDMVAGGEYGLLAALSEKRELVGGLLTRQRSERIVEAWGPYLFHGGETGATAEALLAGCLSRIARGKALGLLSVAGLPASLAAHFESLGLLTRTGAAASERPFYFRHLHEDPGGEVFAAGDLAPWLAAQYERLVLARQIRMVRDMGESRGGHSLFAARLQRQAAEATLRPLWPGADAGANLGRHVRYLSGEGFADLLVEIDLGVPWQAGLMPDLEALGFRPRILLPFAGQADLLILQWTGA